MHSVCLTVCFRVLCWEAEKKVALTKSARLQSKKSFKFVFAKMGHGHSHELEHVLRTPIEELIPAVKAALGFVFPVFLTPRSQNQKIFSLPKDATVEAALETLRQHDLSAVPLESERGEISFPLSFVLT